MKNLYGNHYEKNPYELDGNIGNKEKIFEAIPPKTSLMLNNPQTNPYTTKAVNEELSTLIPASLKETKENSLGQAEPGFLPSFLPLIFIFIIFYFLLIRPQSKKQKKLEQKRRAMKKNDQIILAGGIYGKVIDFKGKADEIVLTEIAKGVNIEVIRSSVVEVLIDEVDIIKRNQASESSKNIADKKENKPTSKLNKKK